MEIYACGDMKLALANSTQESTLVVVQIIIYNKPTIMKDAYKTRISDLIAATEGKLILIEKMMDGVKEPNPTEAKQYLKDALRSIGQIADFVSIS